MAYKFKLDDPLDKGMRRIAAHQLDRACDAFDSLDAKVWVHEARKSLKRVRALLRLVRDGLRKNEWQRLNGELRDIGRLLAGHRDRDVRRDTLGLLAEGASKGLAAAVERVAALEAGLQPDTTALAPVLNCGSESALRQAVDKMQVIRQELATFDAAIDVAHVESGLVRTHRAGRGALEACDIQVTDEQFHELRKVVQIHWRQMQLLGAAWPELFKARIASARALAHDLGIEHDFSGLAQWYQSPAMSHVSRADVRIIVAACRQAQATLRTKALSDAEILFAGRPRVFASEAIAYWSAAVAASAAKACAAKKTSGDGAGSKSVAPAPGRRSKMTAAEKTGASKGEGGGGVAPVRSKRRSKARAAPAS